MDSNEILELENKLLHPTAEPISLPLVFLESITSSFSKEREIGSGAYGVVYKGLLHRGDSFIAVKKIHDSLVVQHDEQFQKEAISLKGIQHPNVIQLLGYCFESKGEMMEFQSGKCVFAEKQTRMLCFEYMCNGGLDKHLSDESSGLEWKTRYEIIKGICSGLHFLHECDIVHLDLKPQNILLDANMMPKIADFSLSRLLVKQKCSTVSVTSDRAGTIGYMAPEYINKGEISKKADIFSLGVIIIEILEGCREYPLYPQSTETNIQQFIEKVFGNWRKRFERESNYTALEVHTQQVKQCIKIALKCMHPERKKRPNALDIIKILDAAESSSCIQNGEDSHVQQQMGSQEGVLLQHVWCKDELLALYRSVMMDNTPPASITEDTFSRAVNTVSSVVAPPQSQDEPGLSCAQHNEESLATLYYQVPRNASFWVVHKALISLEDNVLKQWAANINLGPSIEALEQELKFVKVILEFTLGKVIRNLALEDILMVLQDLVYNAEDVLDEMEYFRIQKLLHDTLDATKQHASDESPKLVFDSDDASQRIKHIIGKMQLVRQEVSRTIKLLGSNWSTAPNIAQSRPITISESIEPKLYGRELMMKSIIDDITKGKHSDEVLTVIPILGPGGIGKTTLAQHIYHSAEVQEYFDLRVWICVSLNFNVEKLTKEIERYIPKGDDESTNDTSNELIRKRIKNKRLLLVLDDIWDCTDGDDWKRLLLLFNKSQVQGNIIIVTTRFLAQGQIMIQKYDHSIYLQGLESKEFKELFLEIVFGDNDQSRKDHTFLLETGFKIADKLKGSPLAAKTVGRLLKTQLDLNHWTRVLESKEWEQSYGKNDIMPSLKLSFDYLPSQLQQCFSYCALFPQDYKFERKDLINFWIGLEVLHPSHGENRRVEDIGLNHLTELVNFGFLDKKRDKDGRTYYTIHDLFHDLARKVSSHECLSIDSSQSRVSSLKVMPSIRHLSIIIDDTNVKDRLTLKNYVEDFNTLGKRLKVEKLRTLMIFGKNVGWFMKAFRDLFWEAKTLRVIFLPEASFNVEDLLHNFYSLVHLRYLRTGSYHRFESWKISRFYHMLVLDENHSSNIIYLPRDVSNLVKLRHFLVGNDATHSLIFEVGKLESLQELRRFVVKQEGQGFELSQIGHLVQLCGSLCIDNLENVQVKEEADEAKLIQKSHLDELILNWNIDRFIYDSTLEEHVLERLKPSNNLLKLSVKGHRGAICPSWLGMNLAVKNLESLCLDGVAWKKFPAIGEFWLVNEPHRNIISGNLPDERFTNMRRLELCQLNMVKKWTVHAPCQLFPFLEVLVIHSCSQLVEFSFEHFACCQQGKEAHVNLFPTRLSVLKIDKCPLLSVFPPVPWTDAPCSINIKGTGSPCLRELVYGKDSNSECSLKIDGKYTQSFSFWNKLAFHNLIGLKQLRLSNTSLSLCYREMLSSLRTLQLDSVSDVFPFVHEESHVEYKFPVERLTISYWSSSGKELTQLLTYFPKLSYLKLSGIHNITKLGVMGQQATATTRSSSSIFFLPNSRPSASAGNSNIQAQGLLLLPPQLKELTIVFCSGLSICSNPLDNNIRGLQGLSSLQRLVISSCPKLLSSYSSSMSPCFPFPNSLQFLRVSDTSMGMMAPLPLSNLSSLTSLSIINGTDLIGTGLLSPFTQGHLTKLEVIRTPKFFVDSELSRVDRQELPSHSSKLQELQIDDVAGFTAMPIRRNLLFSSLTTLEINMDYKLKRFRKEQEALLLVNSLKVIKFMSCHNLQSMPEWLYRLPNLKILHIEWCEAIKMLPKDGLPSSLQELNIIRCPEIRSLPTNCLPDSLQKLFIKSCPAIRSLPEVDDLPSSLRELNVSESGNKELSRQCYKLINIIPIVKA